FLTRCKRYAESCGRNAALRRSDLKTPLESPEFTRIRGCLSELFRIRALPSPGTGGEPSRIAGALLDALLGMLPASFVFVKMSDPEGGPSIEMARTGESAESTGAHEIGEALRSALGNAPGNWPSSARVCIGGIEFSVVSTALGAEGEFGVLAAGSRK